MKKYLVLVSFCLLVSPSQADIYKWTDPDGTVHFSDKPHAGAVTIQLAPTQTYSPEKKAENREAAAEQATETTVEEPQTNPPNTQNHVYTNLSILEPQDQETLRSNQGIITVTAGVEPKLFKGDMLQLFFDNAPAGAPQKTLFFTLNGIYRGTHTLFIQLLNKNGEVIRSTPPITVHMHHSRVNAGGGG